MGPVNEQGGPDPADGPADPRLEQLRARLAAVQRRIDGAVTAAGRQELPPRLIVVTKFHPAEDVRRLALLGVTDVGENRDQEAAEKARGLEDLGLRWHFVGQLQSNKAKSVVKYADAVHSLDRLPLSAALAKAMAAEQERTGRAPLQCFLQVSLDEQAGGPRGGALPADIPALADAVAGSTGLVLAGLMAVAPFGADPAPAFQQLAELSARLTADHPRATGISAGMSQDLEQAIRFGATHLRVGSDILGPRPALG